MIKQIEISLPAYRRGFHLITRDIERNLPKLPNTGMLNIIIKHTSAGITLNENADPSVRTDFESYINRMVPENEPYFTHMLEGSEDMPAHIKSSIIGQTLTIPITNGKLNMGIWQGIYLGEFRNRSGTRNLVITIYGED